MINSFQECLSHNVCCRTVVAPYSTKGDKGQKPSAVQCPSGKKRYSQGYFVNILGMDNEKKKGLCAEAIFDKACCTS